MIFKQLTHGLGSYQFPDIAWVFRRGVKAVAAYNNRTLNLFKSEKDTSVIVASIAFGMGMNLHNITDSINLGLLTTYGGLIQQNGRAG